MEIKINFISFFLLLLILLTTIKTNNIDNTVNNESDNLNEEPQSIRDPETPNEEDEPEEKEVESAFVHILTDDTFEESFNDTPNWLVEFYAPWCGHCQELMPKFIEAAETNKIPNVKYGKVDATIHRKLADKYKIQGYPTILWLTKRDGIITQKPYEQKREAMYINAFVKEEMHEEILELNSVDELMALNPKETGVLLIICDKTDISYDKNIIMLKKTSLRAGKEKIVWSNSAELRKYYGENDIDINFIVGFANDSNGSVFFRFGKHDIIPEDYVKQLLMEKSEILGAANENNVSEILDGPIRSVFIVYKNITDPHVSETLQNGKKVLTKYMNQFYSIHGDGSGIIPQVATIIEALRILPEDFPAVIILDPPVNMTKKDDFLKYKFTGNGTVITENQITSFIEDFKNNKLVNLLSSDPIPNDDLKIINGVHSIVGLTIKEFVNSKGKDVLLNICTSLSWTCRRFTSELERVVKTISNSTLLVGQIDFNNNEFEHIEMTNYPTIVLFKDNASGKERN